MSCVECQVSSHSEHDSYRDPFMTLRTLHLPLRHLTLVQMNSSLAEPDFRSLIRGRRSVRRYAERAVPEEVVWQLLEAAHWAPSAHNRQPWRFVLVEQPATRRRLAEAMAEQWQADLLADGADPEMVGRRAAISIQRVGGAPVLILPCLDLAVLDVYVIRSASSASGRWGCSRWRWLARTCCWPRTSSDWLGVGCVRRSFVFPSCNACWSCRRPGSRRRR